MQMRLSNYPRPVMSAADEQMTSDPFDTSDKLMKKWQRWHQRSNLKSDVMMTSLPSISNGQLIKYSQTADVDNSS